MKRIYIHEEHCIGCRLCEIHCAVEHSKTKDIIKTFKEGTPPLPKLIVEESKPLSFSLQCRHCEDPICVKACITGAMRKEGEKIVLNEDKCVGCWTCIMVCPYGAINRDKEKKTVASKCDLCPDRETPACVEFCPNEALTFEERKK